MEASSKPKLARSTSLPTIDAIHTFQIEKTLENENESEEGENTRIPTPKTPTAGHLSSPPLLLNLTVPRPPSRADSSPLPSPRTPSPPPAHVQTPRATRRQSRSLYSDLRVVLPNSEGATLDALEGGAKSPKSEKGEEGVGESETELEREREEEVEEIVAAGVPNTVIRQASDFEDLSEIHKLMRVHSLPELPEMATAQSDQPVRIQRKLSKGSKSFLKHSKINLLDLSD